MIIKTERLVLRPWEENDAEDLYKYAQNPKIGPIAGWPPHKSVEDSLEIINTVFAKRETYAITKNGEAIGSIGLLIHPDGNHYWGDGCGELGYWIGEPFWGEGLVVEASIELLKHDNFQSKRVLEKLGFKFVDTIINEDFTGERFMEVVMVLENQ